MFAGHDTTSSGLSFSLYMLGTHPEIQRKVQQEIDYVLGDDEDRQITLDDIKELKYLDCVLKETRRLWPPTPFIARDLEEDIIIVKVIEHPKYNQHDPPCGTLFENHCSKREM
ncbi:cytochrome P450 4V2 [Caerostris extrusa]|uniref:Cytochrome P450 4V2 n=1 Tax=Caerostris extrusa TaxID=172846 RepID=A0AAV4SCR7_CAEEX|nr:cytochrome P450 4V2 [Caerostris extrusa]